MNITVFHYHLNPGGVTRIIESQVASFRQNYPECKIQVITGHCENESYYSKINIPVKTNADLNYLENKSYSKIELNDIFESIYFWIKSQISNKEILHVHNLNLGKNPVLTMVFNRLLHEGYSIVNHAHDFAEDRPVNMAFLNNIIGIAFNKEVSEVLYPDNEKFITGVLNQFDYKRVVNYGIEDDRVFLWPNPVFVELKTTKTKSDLRRQLIEEFNIPENHNIITYPVRVIRRKNIGELILLAKLFQNSCTFMVTLPPRNPVEIKVYKKWVSFCSNNDIPLVFEAGIKADFETIICGSDYCITTSIQEGFGMSYLEPWLMGTPVIGRNITYVTGDIKAKGVEFPLLYSQLNVPYKGDLVDFKDLDINQQQELILQLIQGEVDMEAFVTRNDFLRNFPPTVEHSILTGNIETINKEFSLNTYAERIYKAYSTIS